MDFQNGFSIEKQFARFVSANGKEEIVKVNTILMTTPMTYYRVAFISITDIIDLDDHSSATFI